MAVKTQFNIENFKGILQSYSYGSIVSVTPISAGSVQSNYLLETDSARVIFRYYENRTKQSVMFEINLLNFLTAKGYPCPAPLRRRSSLAVEEANYIGELSGKPYVLYEFKLGEHITSPTPEQEDELIKAVAEFNSLTKGYTSPYGQYRQNYNIPFCLATAKEQADRINTKNSRAKLIWYNEMITHLSLPEILPKGVCHCDFHHSNMLYKDGSLNALIDFDDANYTYLTFDLVCLFDPFIPAFNHDSWQSFSEADNILDFTSAKRIVAEYERYRPLEQIERLHLYDVFMLTVFIDCLWYYERGEVSDFYERRKLNALLKLGRDGFYRNIFG